MKEALEWLVYVAIVVVLSGLIFKEGTRYNHLQGQIDLTNAELLKKISHAQLKLQIIDARELEGDNSYDDSHIPGAIPLPGCSLEGAPENVKPRLEFSMPSIIITTDGNKEIFSKCHELFKNSRNLAGGMTAWVDAAYPEDSGEYTPPRASSGGGCL